MMTNLAAIILKGAVGLGFSVIKLVLGINGHLLFFSQFYCLRLELLFHLVENNRRGILLVIQLVSNGFNAYPIQSWTHVVLSRLDRRACSNSPRFGLSELH